MLLDCAGNCWRFYIHKLAVPHAFLYTLEVPVLACMYLLLSMVSCGDHTTRIHLIEWFQQLHTM